MAHHLIYIIVVLTANVGPDNPHRLVLPLLDARLPLGGAADMNRIASRLWCYRAEGEPLVLISSGSGSRTRD